ncbi:MAG TPA: Ig-like domain-containing protein [Bryobacteraceae bacterium]|nr:Ig-like domain-containing protein [Bryobacteraceae bacterium]
MATSRILFLAGALFALAFSNAASAQKISIVQGNGQLICDACPNNPYPSFDDEVVLVTDANGNPMPNQTITWTVTDLDGLATPAGILPASTTTSAGGSGLCNQAGYSCNRYTGGDTQGTTLRVMAVTASLSPTKSVTFTLTEGAPTNPNGSPGNVNTIQVLDPPLGTLFTGTANGGSGTPIHVSVQAGVGPVANISVRLIPYEQNPPGSPTASCATATGADPGSVLTDATGTATCNVVFGPTPSTGTPPTPVGFRVLVGGVANPQFSALQGYVASGSVPYQFTVTPATPATVQKISGDNQSASRGQALTQLVVKVVDANQNPLPLAPVTWSVGSGGGAVITSDTTTTDSNGEATANVTLSSTAAAPVQIIAKTANGISATFTATVNIPITGLVKASGSNGDNQSVSEGQAFPVGLSVQVVPATAGIPVTFAVTSGFASVSATSAVSNAQGLAAVNVTAGNTPGPVTVVASSGSASVTFTLTVSPPGLSLTAANFLNAAGFFASAQNSAALSPCSIGTVVIGTPLTPATLPAVPALFGVAMQQPGASVVFTQNAGPEQAPILMVNAVNTNQTLITFQVPCDLIQGAVQVAVTVNNATTLQPVIMGVYNASPGIFELPMADGVRRAVAVKQDGSFVSLQNPAHRGDIIRIFITGIGPTSPPLVTNQIPNQISGVNSMYTAAYVAVQLGSGDVPVLPSSQASPSLIGVFLLDIMVPANIPLGNNTFLEVGVDVNGQYQFANPGVGSKIPIQ